VIPQEVSARDGDDDRLYRDRFQYAVRLAHLLTGDASVAEDIAQDAYMRVMARSENVGAPHAYFRMAVVNACRSYHRTRARDLRRAGLVATGSTPGIEVRELLDAIDRLPYRQKAVIVLRYYEDLSEDEIARTLNCRPGTVKSLASRALQRLAQEVQR
jgi:DNA-directed RNA polymerase specialized sigma24 family protein